MSSPVSRRNHEETEMGRILNEWNKLDVTTRTDSNSLEKIKRFLENNPRIFELKSPGLCKYANCWNPRCRYPHNPDLSILFTKYFNHYGTKPVLNRSDSQRTGEELSYPPLRVLDPYTFPQGQIVYYLQPQMLQRPIYYHEGKLMVPPVYDFYGHLVAPAVYLEPQFQSVALPVYYPQSPMSQQIEGHQQEGGTIPSELIDEQKEGCDDAVREVDERNEVEPGFAEVPQVDDMDAVSRGFLFASHRLEQMEQESLIPTGILD